jgi:ABC-type transport system involved in multi-copper enzyme maturation permease subunit
MSATLLHYREWQGPLRGSWASVWPIARVALSTLLRRRMFWVVYSAALLLFLMFFFGSYLLLWAETRVSETPIRVGKFAPDPGRVIQAFKRGLGVLNGGQDTFAYFFSYQGTMVMVMLALAGSVLVGNDFDQRSLPFYLAKPIHRWHYLLGKFLAVGVVVNLLTTLPALILFLQHGLEDWSYLTNREFFVEDAGRGPAGWPLLLGVLGYGLVLTVFLSVLLVALATWLKRTVPLVMLWTSLFLFARLLASLLVEVLHLDGRFRLLDLWNNMMLLGQACLGFEHDRIRPAPQPTFLEAGLVLAGVTAVCLIYLNLRTRAVDIIR